MSAYSNINKSKAPVQQEIKIAEPMRSPKTAGAGAGKNSKAMKRNAKRARK